jgi:catechol 2,3-dioxygenase-like lactoylglutathione lyase family enzyme
MFSHVTVGTNNLDRAAAFYEAVLIPLGLERLPGKFRDGAMAWRQPGGTSLLWIVRPYDKQPAARGNGWMVALEAPSRAAVDAAHAAALAGEGTDEGAPGHRPHSFAPDYYGAYVRDLDGNKLHFVHLGEVSFKGAE